MKGFTHIHFFLSYLVTSRISGRLGHAVFGYRRKKSLLPFSQLLQIASILLHRQTMPSALQLSPSYASSRQLDPSEPAKKQQINLQRHLRLLDKRLTRIRRWARPQDLQTFDPATLLESLDLKNPHSLASTMVAGDFLALVSFRLEVFDKLFPYAEELAESDKSTLRRRYILDGWRCDQSNQKVDCPVNFRKNIKQVEVICVEVDEYSREWSRAGIEWWAEALEEYVDHSVQSNSSESIDAAPSLELSAFLHWTEHSYLPDQIHKLETTINQETISMNRTSRSLSITANSLSSQADSLSLIEHQVATLKSQVEYDINTAFVAPLMTDSGEDSESDVSAMASPLSVAESLGDWSELPEDGGVGET
jgi:hypothetical protein